MNYNKKSPLFDKDDEIKNEENIKTKKYNPADDTSNSDDDNNAGMLSFTKKQNQKDDFLESAKKKAEEAKSKAEEEELKTIAEKTKTEQQEQLQGMINLSIQAQADEEEARKKADKAKAEAIEAEIEEHLCVIRRLEGNVEQLKNELSYKHSRANAPEDYQRKKNRLKELKKLIKEAEKTSFLKRILYNFTIDKGTVFERTQSWNAFLREWKAELPKVERQVLAYENGLKAVNQEIQKAQKAREEAEQSLSIERQTLKDKANAYREASRHSRAINFDEKIKQEEWECEVLNLLNLDKSDEAVISTQRKLNYYAENQKKFEEEKINKYFNAVVDELISAMTSEIIKQNGSSYVSVKVGTRENLAKELRRIYQEGREEAVERYKNSLIKQIPEITAREIKEAKVRELTR